MKDLVLLVGGGLVGAFLGLVAAVYFQDPLKARVERRARLGRARAITRATVSQDGPVAIAGTSTTVHLVEGDGDALFEPSNIAIKVRSKAADLPELVSKMRKRTAAQLAASPRQTGRQVSSWNGQDMVSLNGYRLSRTAARASRTPGSDAPLD